MDVLSYIDGIEAPARDAIAPWASRIPAGLLARTRLVELPTGDALVHMLDRCEQVYVLTRGRVRSTSRAETGSSFTIDEFCAPAVFGEMEVLADSQLYHSSLVALEPSELIATPRCDYLAWLTGDPEALLARSRSVVRSLLRQAGTERSLIGWSGTKRVMFVLAQCCRQAAGEPPVTIRDPRSELAERAGVSTKTVSHALEELEGQGLLRRAGRGIVIDRAGLGRLDAELRHEFESNLPHGTREKE